MSTRRSSFAGEGWNLDLETNDAVVHLTLLLVDVGIPAAVRFSLPTGSAEDAVRAVAAVLYADQELLVQALKIHAAQQDGERGMAQLVQADPA